MTRTFAYCRVSTADQHTENQIAEIKAAGYDIRDDRIVIETISGSTFAMARPQFAKLLERLERADVLVVTKLDRLGRNAMDVRSTVVGLADRDVRTVCLQLGGVDLTSPAGKMTMGVIAAVAEFERDLLIERTQAGLDRAKRSGKRLGRPRALSKPQLNEIASKRLQGASLGVLAAEYQVSRSAIYRATRVTRIGSASAVRPSARGDSYSTDCAAIDI